MSSYVYSTGQQVNSSSLYSFQEPSLQLGRMQQLRGVAVQSIPCSPKCKIVGQILLDHPLNFMNNVRQKKEAIQYPRFIKLILADLMKKFLEIPQRIEEDYHSIKDDIPLVSVYTTRDVRVQGMLILDEFLTKEIRATDDFKEYKTVFMNVDVPLNQP
ncbi:hypothetical protein Tco_0851360 [Tanacetum coccineum]